ncbi:paramyosin [Halyomorpha halys]|uniref:paramyosin n=1 Tax=Halyomorpha halys TaxID=286706 RepID=UPI0006D4C95D|nr:major antigen-like [Halyomorpha halys]
MSVTLSDDLNEILTSCYEHFKEHTMLKGKLKDNEKFIAVLKLEVTEARRAEKRAASNLKRVQENVLQLQGIISGLTAIREDNEKLKSDLRNLETSLENEKQNLILREQQWLTDKENLIKSNKEELENMKMIRNMEAISFNQELDRLREENQQKIEDMKRGFSKLENEYKNSLSRTVEEYEEKLLNLNRNLIAANNEVKNLRQISGHEQIYNLVDFGQPKNDRKIQQPLSFSRYKPLPIVSTASQIFASEMEELSKVQHTTPSPNQTKTDGTRSNSATKKRKLYCRTDDPIL